MDKTLSYGIGAGAGVIEYHLLKKVVPANTNTAAAGIGAAMLGTVALNLVKNSDINNVLVGNGFTLVAITLTQAFINPTAASVAVRCPSC